MLYFCRKTTTSLVVGLLLFTYLQLSAQEEEESKMVLIVQALTQTDKPAIQVNILKGVLTGLRGAKPMDAPEGWAIVSSKLLKSSDTNLRNLVIQLSQKFGDEGAIAAAFQNVKDSKADINLRRAALRSLVSQNYQDLLPALESLLKSPLKLDAIRAYGTFNDKSVPLILLKNYSSFDSSARRTVIETLATRKEYAQALLKGLKKGTVKKAEIPVYVARSLKNILGKSFTDVYGDMQQLSQDKTKLIAKYKSKLHSPAFAKANASNGRAIFQRTCAVCHKLYDTGGIIGPDLTGSNRADQDYILLNIIDPSFDMPEAYRMVTVTKKDGQILTGNIVEEDQQKIVVSMVGAKNIVSKADIKKRVVSKVSMMPEGLLKTLNDKEFLDLIKYLQTEKQVEMPK